MNAMMEKGKVSGFTLLKAGVWFLAALYLLNSLSPLRLHVDTLRYFAIKDCVEIGCPPDSDAAKDYLPWGYTGLMLALSKVGLLHSFTIILINCLFLAGSLFYLKKMFRSLAHPYLFIAAVLLSWVMIKFVTHPLSEMQYLFFSTLSLYFFYRYTQNRGLWTLGLSFLCAGLAFLTRSVGVALVASLVAGLLWFYRKELIQFILKNKIAVGITGLLVLISLVFAKQLGLSHYTNVFNKQFTEGVGIVDVFRWHFIEWAELVLNTSKARLGALAAESTLDWVFVVLGILFFAGFVFLLFRKNNELPFIIKFYLFFYAVLMFNWPFYDPRFWVPVWPMVIMVLLTSDDLLGRVKKIFLLPLPALYTTLGILSIGYITYTSLNKEVFVQKQANGVYRNEYETLFYGKPTTDTARIVDPATLSVLKRHN